LFKRLSNKRSTDTKKVSRSICRIERSDDIKQTYLVGAQDLKLLKKFFEEVEELFFLLSGLVCIVLVFVVGDTVILIIGNV
jgi:hypothetical protein